MARIRKDIRETQIRNFVKTNRRFSIVDTLNAARLIDPKHYPYVQKSRLRREITDGCKDALDQIHQLIGRLPVEFRNELLKTDAVRTIRNFTLQALREGRYAGKPFNQAEFDHYCNLLDEALEGMQLMLPHQSNTLIDPHAKALRDTLHCFSEFGKTYGLQTKIPTYTVKNDKG